MTISEGENVTSTLTTVIKKGHELNHHSTGCFFVVRSTPPVCWLLFFSEKLQICWDPGIAWCLISQAAGSSSKQVET